MNDNEYMAIAKEFTRLMGQCWHEWQGYINKNDAHVGRECIHCRIHTMFIPELPANPTWNNPAEISNTIKAVKCRDCGGSGWQDNEECDNLSAARLCPTCSGIGTINLWDEFVEWHDWQVSRTCWDGLDNTVECNCQVNSAEILLTPKLLMQSYISFARGRE